MASVVRRIFQRLFQRRVPMKMKADYTGADPELHTLFAKHHYNGKRVIDALLFLAYVPIGIALMFTRIYLALILLVVGVTTNVLGLTTQIFTPWVRLQLLRIFGFWPKFVNLKAFVKAPKPLIMASNHRTAFDLLPFIILSPFDVMIDKQFYESSWISRTFLHQIKAFVDTIKVEVLAKEDVEGRQRQKNAIVAHMNKTQRPLLFFPEGWDTCGKALLEYQPFMFGLGLPILPVALNAYVPFLPITPGKLGTTIARELLWFFFCPAVIFEITFMEPQTKREAEDSPTFARRIQHATADMLNILPTRWTKHDALKYRRTLLKQDRAM